MSKQITYDFLRDLFSHLTFSVEELTCLATWRNGNLRYLVGLLSHNHTASDEDRYRCFAYERIFSNGN